MGVERKLAKIQALGEKKNWEKIVKKFADAKNPDLRVAAAKALSGIQVDEAYNKLVLLIRDSDINVKKAAITALGDMGRKAGADHCRHVMNHTDDADLISICQTAIAKIVNSDNR